MRNGNAMLSGAAINEMRKDHDDTVQRSVAMAQCHQRRGQRHANEECMRHKDQHLGAVLTNSNKHANRACKRHREQHLSGASQQRTASAKQHRPLSLHRVQWRTSHLLTTLLIQQQQTH